jgi:hypothetical protein
MAWQMISMFSGRLVAIGSKVDYVCFEIDYNFKAPSVNLDFTPMRYFSRYAKLSCGGLILAVTALLSGCSIEDLESFTSQDGGVEQALDAIALRQVEEYKKTRKFASTLKVNISCYKDYSKISLNRDTVTNFAIKKYCFDHDYSVPQYMSQVISVNDTPWRDPPIVEVRCLAFSDDYPVKAFEQASFIPRLFRGQFPECPRGDRGKIILPELRDYSMPRQSAGLADRQSIIRELDRISDRQAVEFNRTGQYDSALSFNAECGRYVSTLLQAGKTVINWIDPTTNCQASRAFQDRPMFVSAVFAVEDKQKRTVTVSRIVCEVDQIGGDTDIVQAPPHLVNGVPICQVKPTDDRPRLSGGSQTILTEKYPSVPAKTPPNPKTKPSAAKP